MSGEGVFFCVKFWAECDSVTHCDNTDKHSTRPAVDTRSCDSSAAAVLSLNRGG